jgi:hypothetical protein
MKLIKTIKPINQLTKNEIMKTLSQSEPTKAKIELNSITHSFLSDWEDENRDRMRDFMNLMSWGYNHQLDLSPKPIKDEVEYLKKVYRYYIWDVIYNHYLTLLLMNDREGKLDTPISETSAKELEEELIRKTTYTYNNRVLGKGQDNWDDKVELDGRF